MSKKSKPSKSGLNKAIEEVKAKSAKPAAKPAAKENKALTPKTEKTPAAKVEAPKAPRASNVDGKKFKLGDVSKLREGSNGRVISEAFGKGKSVADAIGDLELTFEAKRSAVAKNNLRAFVVGYVNSCVKAGHLIAV